MTKLSVEFHATRREISDWITSWVQHHRVYIAEEIFFPSYTARAVDVEPSLGRYELAEAVNRVVLGAGPLDLDAALPLGLPVRNPDSLSVLIGEQTADQLGESMFGARTDDPGSLVWRRGWRMSAFTDSVVYEPLAGLDSPDTTA